MKRIHIAAAIIFDSTKDNVFITKRPDKAHKGGLWEFPGGKVETQESAEEATVRELYEEVGIKVTELSHFEALTYDYPDKSLKFDFFVIEAFENSPYGKEGQQGEWVAVEELINYEFPEANVPILHRVIKEYR